MTDTDKDARRAREILDDPRNFIKDPIAGPIPVHFNALYDVLATALRQARRETWLEAAALCARAGKGEGE